jgi:FHS family glucose/mannose:H+ symporter-like MFS transporter
MEFPNYLSLFLFSFFMMSASPILLDISKYFGVSPEKMNLIITYFMIGEAAGFLILIFLSRKYNRKIIVLWAYILIIPILIGLTLVTHLALFNILYFFAGCILGIIFMNANLSMLEGEVKNKDSVINLGHGFFAIGALVSPFLTSTLVDKQMNWRLIYIIVIGFAVISLISYLIVNKNKKDSPLPEKEAIPIKKLFKDRKRNIYLILTAVLMLFYVMSEITVFSWAPTFFRIMKSFSLNDASLVASVFWLGILIGRLIISFLSYRFKAGVLLMALSAISLVGLTLAIFPTTQIINFLGIGIIGLGFSGIPPLLISSGGRIFGSGREISLTLLFVIGVASGSTVPFIISLVAEYNFLMSMVIAIIFMVIFGIFVFIRKTYRKTLKAK